MVLYMLVFIKYYYSILLEYIIGVVRKMTYKEFKEKQSEEFNSFIKGKVIILLGSEEEALAKLEEENLTTSDIVNLGAGTYIIKKYLPEYEAFNKQQDKEYHEYLLNNVYEVVNTELWNYETEISLSYSYNDVIYKIVGLTKEEAEANKVDVAKAIEDYKEEFYKLN